MKSKKTKVSLRMQEILQAARSVNSALPPEEQTSPPTIDDESRLSFARRWDSTLDRRLFKAQANAARNQMASDHLTPKADSSSNPKKKHP